MITAFDVGNFKAFAETQHIPIKPITLIFGPNSAGKSSFIHSIALAHEALRTGRLDVHKTELGGTAIDLGGFRQYVHRTDVARRVEWGTEIATSRLKGRLAELLAPARQVAAHLSIGIALDDAGRPVPGAEPKVTSYEMVADGQILLRMSRRPDGTLRLDRLDQEHAVIKEILKAIVTTATTTDSITPSDFVGIGEAIAQLLPELRVVPGNLFPSGIATLQAKAREGEQPGLFPVSRGNRSEDLANAIRFFLPRTLDELIKGVSGVLSDELRRLQYLGPLRSFPPRHLAFSEHEDANWYAGGGYAWDVVRRNDAVRAAVNRWLGAEVLKTPYELRVRKLIAPENEGEALEKWVLGVAQAFDWIRERSGELSDEGFEIIESLGFLDKKEGPYPDSREHDPWAEWETDVVVRLMKSALAKGGDISELILLDQRNSTPVTHRDVGIGITQVLPVLVMAYASREKLIAMEQPEIHLHPALQAELGDLFIEGALGERKNTFILETHSEHLILRIMRRMRETFRETLPNGFPRVRPEDVAVLYVEPDGTRSIVREMLLNEAGDLVKAWPGGFFEEALRETF